MDTYHRLIPQKAIKQIDKFIADLRAFAEETGEDAPLLYEDANTTIQIIDLVFAYDGSLNWIDESGEYRLELYITEDEEGNEVWDEMQEWESGLKYWRDCLKRAKRYWRMDTEKLDAIQDGTLNDEEE